MKQLNLTFEELELINRMADIASHAVWGEGAYRNWPVVDGVERDGAAFVSLRHKVWDLMGRPRLPRALRQKDRRRDRRTKTPAGPAGAGAPPLDETGVGVRGMHEKIKAKPSEIARPEAPAAAIPPAAGAAGERLPRVGDRS